MNYALIKNGVCENIIEANQDFIEKIRSEWDEIVPAAGTMAEKKATWNGKEFIRIISSPAVEVNTDPLTAISAKVDELTAKVDELTAKVDAVLVSTGTVTK